MLPGPEHRLVSSANRASRPSQRRTTPLRSVENKLKLKSPKLFSADGIGSHPSNTANTRPIMSNFTLNNNPIPEIGVKIRTEPFTDHYSVESEIGRGKFAVVKKCRNKHNGLEYAAKFLRKRRKGKDCRAEFLHEVGMLEMALPHPRLVDLVEVFETTSELIIITEYAAGGELFQQVVREEKFSEKDVIYMMRQILEGLQFLHNRCIVHMDVKPQNILLTREMPYGDIKICDLGLARLVSVGEELREIIGTPDYVAPEVLQYEPIHLATDMWSVGVLTYVLLTGISPFAGDTKQETFCNIGQAEVDFPDDLFEDISKEAIQFMEALLVREPEKRMSARECLSHCWLCQGDTTKLPSGHSPFGSPVGCRRALTPSPDGFLNSEPSKKCKCSGKEVVNGKSDSEKENDLLGNDLESQNCTECTPPCNSKRGHLDAPEDNARRDHERKNENSLSRRNDVRRSLQTVNTDKTPPKFGKPRFLKNPLS